MRKVNVKQRKRLLPFLVIRKQKKSREDLQRKENFTHWGEGCVHCPVVILFCICFVCFVYVMFYSVTTLLIDLTLNKQFQCVHFLSLAFTQFTLTNRKKKHLSLLTTYLLASIDNTSFDRFQFSVFRFSFEISLIPSLYFLVFIFVWLCPCLSLAICSSCSSSYTRVGL